MSLDENDTARKKATFLSFTIAVNLKTHLLKKEIKVAFAKFLRNN